MISRYDGLKSYVSNDKLIEHADDMARQHAAGGDEAIARRRTSSTPSEFLEYRLDRPSYITVLDVDRQDDEGDMYDVEMDIDIEIPE